MKSLCNREGMLAAIAMVGGVAPARSPKPILQNLKFVVDSTGSTLMATDLELGIRYMVSGVRVDEPGSVILPYQRMQQVLRLSNEIDLTVESNNEKIDVRGGRSKWNFTAEDPTLFPEVPSFTARSYYLMKASDLRRLIRRTVFATDVESTRYALGGVLLEFGEHSISMVGTDGRRLAKMTVPAEVHGEVEKELGFSPVIPVKALKLIERNLTDDEIMVHVAILDNNAAVIRTDRAMIHTRLVEGRFPRYQDVFPSQHEARISMKAGALLRVVQQSMIVTSEESRGVDFHFSSGVLNLDSQSPDVGDSHLDIPIDYDGKTIDIKFDPRYLVEALQTIDENSELFVDLIDSKAAALFHTSDNYDYIVMPLSRDA
ncbi:MAG: DNA polymerase III subunit beta [Planctomycetota bacterium]|nr:DNA polymerase III subunit beta [Planctomycetota bacterium]RLS25488.1 MAG: DNA polymerase III subunit beta [Planctomycetota bacterium]